MRSLHKVFLGILSLCCLILAVRSIASELLPPGPLGEVIDRGEDPDAFLENMHTSDFHNERSSQFELRDGERDQGLGPGILITTVGSGDDAGRAVVMQSDGKIVVAGRYTNSGSDDDFVVIRYHPDGELDTSFAGNGKAFASFGGSATDDFAHGLTLDASGRPILVGRTDLGTANVLWFGVARFTTGGVLDTSFNSTGLVSTQLSTRGNFARGVAVQTDGMVLVAGYNRVGSYHGFAVARYLSSGALDTSFNTNGKLTIANGANDNGANAIVLQTDAKIALGGASYGGSNWDFASLRLTTDGALDTSFNTSGKLTTPVLSSDDVGFAMVVQTTGRIVMGGGTYNGTKWKYGAVRWNTDGSLDTTFNSTGKLSTSIGTGDEKIFGIGMETNGAFWAAGYSYNGTDNDFSVARYRSNGALDTSFKTTGKITQAIISAEDTAQAMAMLGDGIPVVIGRGHNGSNLDFALARYNTDGSPALSGKLDKSMGTLGKLSHSVGTSANTVYAVTQQTDGRLLGAGQISDPVTTTNIPYAILRFNLDGALDTTFNTTGYYLNVKSTFQGGSYGIAIQADRKAVQTGYQNTVIPVFVTSRYNTNGTIDTSFNNSGAIVTALGTPGNNEAGYGIVLQTDQKIIVAGMGSNGTKNHFLIGRYLTSGALDTSFNTNGKKYQTLNASQHEEIFALALQTDGALVAVGYANDGTYDNFAIARYTTEGRMDTSFNTKGFFMQVPGAVSVRFYGVAIAKDATIVAVGADTSAYVYRFLTSGALDTSFSTLGRFSKQDGATATSARGVGIATNDKLVLGGRSGSVALFTVMRLTTGGMLDTSFNTTGLDSESMISGVNSAYGVYLQRDGRILMPGGHQNGSSTDYLIMRFWP